MSAAKRGRKAKYEKPDGASHSAARFQVSMNPAVFDALERFRKDQPYIVERSAVIEEEVVALLVKTGYLRPEDVQRYRDSLKILIPPEMRERLDKFQAKGDVKSESEIMLAALDMFLSKKGC